MGTSALFGNTTGLDNVATGVDALGANTTGNQNVATGTDALLSNATGNNSVATGVGALFLGLRPVSYRYKAGDAAPQYGLIAEEVARRLPALVQRGPDGRPAGVCYQELPVLLLAQLQREHHRNAARNRRIYAQDRRLRRQQRQIDWLMRRVRRR